MRRGTFFIAGNQRFLGLYSRNSGVVYDAPPGTEHAVHMTYQLPGAPRRNADYFLANGQLPFEPKKSQIAVEISAEDMARYERRFGIRHQIARKFGDLAGLIRNIAAVDVRGFWNAKLSERGNLFSGSPKINYLDSAPEVEFVDGFRGSKLIVRGDAHIDRTGKQDFYAACLLDLNLDFANWCLSGITLNMKLAPWNCCDYCYSAYQHKDFPFVFRVDKALVMEGIREAQALRAQRGKSTRYMRLGKRVEAGLNIFRGQLGAALEACIDSEIKCIMPTKFLEFDTWIANLLRRSDSTLLISLGLDELERGACLRDRTQEARIADGLRFKEAGVRVIPYLLVNAVNPFSWTGFEKRFEDLKKKFGRIQMIPIRVRYPELGHLIGGWDNCITTGQGQNDLFAQEDGGYFKAPDATRLPERMHPFIERVVGTNNGDVRMCSHGRDLHCGKCFMPGEEGVVIRDYAYAPVKTKETRS